MEYTQKMVNQWIFRGRLLTKPWGIERSPIDNPQGMSINNSNVRNISHTRYVILEILDIA